MVVKAHLHILEQVPMNRELHIAIQQLQSELPPKDLLLGCVRTCMATDVARSNMIATNPLRRITGTRVTAKTMTKAVKTGSGKA